MNKWDVSGFSQAGMDLSLYRALGYWITDDERVDLRRVQTAVHGEMTRRRERLDAVAALADIAGSIQ